MWNFGSGDNFTTRHWSKGTTLSHYFVIKSLIRDEKLSVKKNKDVEELHEAKAILEVKNKK